MTKKKQKRPLNTYIGGSRSNKKKTKRNVLGITGGEGEGNEFGVIWGAYEGINDILKETSDGKTMVKSVISAGRRFIVSALIVALRSKEAIKTFMEANSIAVPPEIEGVEFEPEDREFILLFKTDQTTELVMSKAYKNCLKKENGVVKKLDSKFKEVIATLSKQTKDISSQPGAGKVFNERINKVKEEIKNDKSSFFSSGTKGILETVEKEINNEQGTTTAAADTVEGEVAVVEDTAEAGAETTTEAGAVPETKSIFSRMIGSNPPQEEGTGTGTGTETGTETETGTPTPEPKESFSSKFSGFFNKSPAAPAEKTVEQPIAQTDGGSRKKRKYHKRKYRKSSQRKK